MEFEVLGFGPLTAAKVARSRSSRRAVNKMPYISITRACHAFYWLGKRGHGVFPGSGLKYLRRRASKLQKNFFLDVETGS